MQFPYKELAADFLAPFVVLNLNGARGWIGFEAYVDSGASVSIFQDERAEILGVDYRQGKEILVKVGDGGLIEVFVHQLPVELAGERFTADIGFSAQLGIGFNLLGRRSFFDHFRVCFDDQNRKLDLSPHNPNH